MKKVSVIFFAIAFTLTLSSCSQKESKKIPDPASDPGGYVSGMIDLKNNAEKNIQDSVNKENEKINNALNQINETNMNEKYSSAIIKTTLGNIKVEFYPKSAPETVNNFLTLSDKAFYNGIKFHRVIKGFMIQAGDPLSKDNTKKMAWGTGGPGYQFDDELSGEEKYPQGTLAMANAGPNTNGSQFFIVTASPEAPLPPNYTVFGKVISGMDTALKIEKVKTTQNDRPVEDIVIEKIELLEK